MSIPLSKRQREYLAKIEAQMTEAITRANQQQADLRQQGLEFLNYILLEAGADQGKKYKISDDGMSLVESIDPTKAKPAQRKQPNKAAAKKRARR